MIVHAATSAAVHGPVVVAAQARAGGEVITGSTARPILAKPRYAFLIPITVVWTGWLIAMASGDRWHLFAAGWPITITMVFGSLIAGSTSVGGGAVAFPVMTLLLGASPETARDFALMIQTVGMNGAAFLIFFLRVPVERRAILYGTVGGAIGVMTGLSHVHVPPDYAKLLFMSIWMAFALALYCVNRYRDREVQRSIAGFRPRHALLLVVTGVVGGLVSSIIGTGLDICAFSLLVLWLRIDEKVATPTAVVLMAWNSTLGFLFKQTFLPGGMDPAAIAWWWVAIPVVVVGAPVGAWFIRTRSRHCVAGILYVAIIAQFLWAVYVLKVYQQPRLAAFCLTVIACGVVLFQFMARLGRRYLRWLRDTPHHAC